MTASDRAQRTDAAIAEFLAACDAGSPPNRTAFLAQYPELAESLAPFLDDHLRMKRAAAPFAPETTLGFEGADGPVRERIRYVGDYELIEEIAHGGMGVVYRARQVSVNREVAVKMVLAGDFAKPADLARFRLESEAAANLDHPHILPIFEVGQHEQRPYFSMKLIHGGSLAEAIAKGTSQRELIRILMAVARAVQFAHQHGVLHRDLKPANILIDWDGTPYVTDFGLAKRTDRDDGRTHTGAVLGTPGYMPPEQARGEKGLSTAADVYGLGAILYEILTGRPPFRGETMYATIKQVIETDPAEPGSVVPGTDRDLAAIAMKCLAKTPADRYVSADDLADDLERWWQGEPTRARPPGAAANVVRWIKRNALTAAGLIGYGLLAGTLAIFAPWAMARNSLPILLPEHTAWYHPLALFNAAQNVPAFRMTLIVLAGGLVLGHGWLIQGIMRPRSSRIALAAGGVIALMSTLIAFAFYGPLFASQPSSWRAFQLHPVESYEELFQRGDSEIGFGNTFVPPNQVPHLSRYLTDEQRDADPQTRKRALEEIQRQAIMANRLYGGLLIGWIILVVLGSFLGLWSIHGAWAADLVSRSGRTRIAQAGTYWELALPTLIVGLFCLMIAVITIMINTEPTIGGPSRAARFFPAVAGMAVVILAHVGIVKRLPILIRMIGYAASLGLAGWLMWMFGVFA